MPEIITNEKNVPLTTSDSNPLPAETSTVANSKLISPLPETVKGEVAGTGKENATFTGPAVVAEGKPLTAHTEPLLKPIRPTNLWGILAILLLLLFVLVFFAIRTHQKDSPKTLPSQTQSAKENSNLSNYSAFVAKNKALKAEKYSEQILNDDPFAGQAPMRARANGPVVSSETDPQLAALVDAFRIRVRVFQGSQSLVRNQMLTSITKGELRGFKVQAIEKIENGKIISEEAQFTTPRNGLLKTVDRVLDSLQKTDLPGVLVELKNAGMEFLPLPALAGATQIRGQLRFTAAWGKAVPKELLISGNEVGGLTLGMPVAQLKGRLFPTYSILKRKVLVNNVYYDIYKITDQKNEPLLYLYEKQGKVFGISIISQGFRTEKGVGIASTLDQIRLLYPQVKLAFSGKKTPFVQLEGVAGIFIIQNEGDKKVISILIGESPEFE